MPPERKSGESLNEYIARLESLADTRKIRIHPDYVGELGEVLVKPVISYAVDADGTPHELMSTGGLTRSAQIYDEDHAIAAQDATVATQATLVPTAPNIYYLYGIWVEDTTLNWAANRTFTPQIVGLNNFPLCTGTLVTAGSVDAQIWPTKEADNAKAVLPPFPISNAYYLEIEDDMAAAETAIVHVTYVHRSSEL